MPKQLTADDARQSLNCHVAVKGVEVFQKYGPQIGWKELQQIVRDGDCVRYPCEIVFESSELQPGEMAHPVPKGDRPEDGFTIYVHPIFMTQLAQVPAIVLYQLVLVNYGEFASSNDAETFGAAACGLEKDDYYDLLCSLADQLGSCGDS